MNKFELQKLRDLPIEGVAERLGLQVTRHKCLCPFHEDHHASLSFCTRRNMYRCFVCGENGDTISLTMKVSGKSFVDACRWLADENNVILTEYKPKETRPLKPFDSYRYARYFEHPWLSPEARRFLFDERRLDTRVVSWCRLTSWRDKHGVPWLQIPYYDREGKLIGVQNRNLTAGSGLMVNGSSVPRFRFPQGSECSIYNLPILNMLHPGEALYIAEGCSDCWSLLSAGHKAVAIPSATLLKRKDAELLETLNLKHGTKFHMYPDNDVPGERLFLQLQELLPNMVRHELPNGVKDFSEFYRVVV